MIKIKTPCTIFAEDYHEFESILDSLKQASGEDELKYKACGALPDSNGYAAVFYLPGELGTAEAMVSASFGDSDHH